MEPRWKTTEPQNGWAWEGPLKTVWSNPLPKQEEQKATQVSDTKVLEQPAQYNMINHSRDETNLLSLFPLCFALMFTDKAMREQLERTACPVGALIKPRE
ncbi:hypothetical protein BTVI_118632 [Pitangus sulphuratus]|nr:hypothetical protein BTVI_118632 [Pitangus sulphuratus]